MNATHLLALLGINVAARQMLVRCPGHTLERRPVEPLGSKGGVLMAGAYARHVFMDVCMDCITV